MFTSIDDVTPIDSNEVGNRVADFLQSAGQIALIVTGAMFVLTLIIGIVVAKKAGYSGWWGALAVLVPPIGVILALLFAFLKWPALKERDEALGILSTNGLTLPSHERAAIKEAERKQHVEEEARRRMEKAQEDRRKAEADRERFRASQAAKVAGTPAAPPPPAPEGTSGDTPADAKADTKSADTKPADAPAAGSDAKPAQESQSAKEAESAKKPSASEPTDKQAPKNKN